MDFILKFYCSEIFSFFLISIIIDFILFLRKRFDLLLIVSISQYFFLIFVYFFQNTFFYLVFLHIFLITALFYSIYLIISSFEIFNLFDLIFFYCIFLFFYFLSYGDLFTFHYIYSILGIYIFVLFRIIYLFFTDKIDDFITFSDFGYFLNFWNYAWLWIIYSIFNLMILLYFWNFKFLDYRLIFENIFYIFNIFNLIFALFFYPYLLYASSLFTDYLFSKRKYKKNEHDKISRFQTLKNALNLTFKVLITLFYAGFFFISFRLNFTILSNLALLGAGLSYVSKDTIQDWINGSMIFFEDTINIGDIVEINNIIGEVESITLRLIKIRNFQGYVFVIPFHKVEEICNRSKDFVFICLEILVGSNFDSKKINSLIQKAFFILKESGEFNSYILDSEISCIGITSVNVSGAIYEAKFKSKPYSVRLIKGRYFTILKELFDAENIQFGNPLFFLQSLAAS